MNYKPQPTATVVVRRGFDQRTWSADVEWSDGNKWKSWCTGYTSRQRLIDHATSYSCVTGVEVRS